MDKLDEIRRIRDRYEAAMDETERLRDEYHQAIVTLHRSGATLREIADGLGISHQRVHQIVSPTTTRSRSRARAAFVGAAIVVALALGGFAIRSATSPDTDRSSSSAPPSSESQRSMPSVGTAVTLNPRTGRILPTVVVLNPSTGRILALRASDLADIIENTPSQ